MLHLPLIEKAESPLTKKELTEKIEQLEKELLFVKEATQNLSVRNVFNSVHAEELREIIRRKDGYTLKLIDAALLLVDALTYAEICLTNRLAPTEKLEYSLHKSNAALAASKALNLYPTDLGI